MTSGLSPIKCVVIEHNNMYIDQNNFHCQRCYTKHLTERVLELRREIDFCNADIKDFFIKGRTPEVQGVFERCRYLQAKIEKVIQTLRKMRPRSMSI